MPPTTHIGWASETAGGVPFALYLRCRSSVAGTPYEPMYATLVVVREARRLVTSIDLDAAAGAHVTADRQMSIAALHELELTTGQRVTLLDDRGWAPVAGATSGPSPHWRT